MNNIIQWNCNGCTSHYPELQMLICNYDPFAICLQESHLKPTQPFTVKGYKVYRCDDNIIHRAKGGVCTLIKDIVSARQVNILSNLQVLVVEIVEPFHITLCNIYLPNNNWTYTDLISVVQQLSPPFLIVGDFNSHNVMWGSQKTDNPGRLVERVVDSTNTIILNSGAPTHFNARNGNTSVIDLAISTSDIAHKYNWNQSDDLHGSDHFPIIISNDITTTHRSYPTRWNLTHADWEQYRNSFEHFEIPDDINEATKMITESILRSASQSIPTYKKRHQRKTVPWWNPKVDEAIHNKRRALRKFNVNPTEENLISYKKLKATARKYVLEAKRMSWKTYVSEICPSTPLSIVWQRIKRIDGNKYTETAPLLKHNDALHTDTSDIVEILADTFEKTSRSENYSNDFRLQKDSLEIKLDFEEQGTQTHSYNSLLTFTEMQHALKSMKNKAPGPDNIPARLLMELPKKMKLSVLFLFNKIWLAGMYPDKWREATIIPALKTGKSIYDPNSYRPISLTCYLSKVLEKIINCRLMWVLNTENKLSSFQSGFRKHRSTTDNLVQLENAILDTFAKRHNLVAIFFDIERAFDMTWRYGIMRKIHSWGFRGNLPKFLSDFMHNRIFRVRLGDTLSTVRPLENGIPQGSILSVTLFLIAINDIAAGLTMPVNALLYADDLILYTADEFVITAKQKLQEAINTVSRTASEIGFKFSTTKTKSIHFYRGTRNLSTDPKFYIDRTPIVTANTVKYLGMIFDHKLTWKPHIEMLVANCKRRLAVLKCLSNINWGANREIILMLYKALIQSRIDYGSAIYSSARKTVIKRLDPLLHESIRLATGAFRTSPKKSLYCDSGIQSLYHRRLQISLNYVARISSIPSHPNYNVLFSTEDDSWDIRCKTTPQPLKSRIAKHLKETTFDIPAIFNRKECRPPPWNMPQFKIHFDLTKFNKTNTESSVIHQILIDIINKYDNPTRVYTDGSKVNSNVACAVYDCNNIKSWRLQNGASIFTAELYAIFKSLCLIEDSVRNNTHAKTTYLIISDSLSALQSLADTTSSNELADMIIDLVHKLNQHNILIDFIWVPSHKHIKGNEIVDMAAKAATYGQPEETIPLLYTDVKNCITHHITMLSQVEWNRSNEKLHEIKPSVGKWLSPVMLKRRECILITRLRIGHTKMTHGYILDKINPPRCRRCNENATVKHILTECQGYIHERRIVSLGKALKEILAQDANSIEKILKFCELANIFHHI